MDLDAILTKLAALPISVDWSALEQSTAGVIVEGLGTLLKAEAADVRAYALQIAKSGFYAIRTGRQDWHDELLAQVRGLGELLRIRTETVEWDMIQKIISVAFKGVIGAFGAIK